MSQRSAITRSLDLGPMEATSPVFNAKSNPDKYNTPGVYAADKTFLCKNYDGVTYDGTNYSYNKDEGKLTQFKDAQGNSRFGIDDGRTRTLEEVGKVFNVTRERIRQIESKAIRKLKHPSRSKKLKDFLD